jgi:hypothetical protein
MATVCLLFYNGTQGKNGNDAAGPSKHNVGESIRYTRDSIALSKKYAQ